MLVIWLIDSIVSQQLLKCDQNSFGVGDWQLQNQITLLCEKNSIKKSLIIIEFEKEKTQFISIALKSVPDEYNFRFQSHISSEKH